MAFGILSTCIHMYRTVQQLAIHCVHYPRGQNSISHLTKPIELFSWLMAEGLMHGCWAAGREQVQIQAHANVLYYSKQAGEENRYVRTIRQDMYYMLHVMLYRQLCREHLTDMLDEGNRAFKITTAQ